MRYSLILLFLLLLTHVGFAADPDQYVTTVGGKGRFPLFDNGKATPLLISRDDDPGVMRALTNLKTDLGKVTKSEPTLLVDQPDGRQVVLVGTLGKSPLIDQLVQAGKLDVSAVAGKWETFLTQTVSQPMPGVDRALVIAGSDRRGTIYGIYDLSEQIGVSPWSWWADAPVLPKTALYVLAGKHTRGTPAVKYRGIFINDEAPALSGWAKEKFGGFNHQFYEHVFELILRLKGNYLWPAMWGSAFYDDDKLNPQLANEYGVVIGTSHHEPLMRAHDEWRRYGKGPWNYQTNDSTLRAFWRKSVERTGSNESIMSVGMRGDGDEPMTRETATTLLERIVADQRKIISDVTGKPAEQTPQSWALYKEVQDYYDKGMRVPDDVTLLLCDDNWGNIRKLPAPRSAAGDTPKRKGGYGIYYHFDYVGGPRNYKWVNTNPIARVWEQMHLAYEHGVDQIWIVNVGDIKPMEFPISFFLDYAWNPGGWPANKLNDYTEAWVRQQFGGISAQQTKSIAELITQYTKYNARRKPELLSPDTYSLTNYREAETVVADYDDLLTEAEEIEQALPATHRDAFFQLVLHPIKACANLNDLYVTAGQNRLYARQGRATTNDLADRVKALFERDAQITRYYNDTLAGGKWHHMMDQTHIGYTNWQQPDKNGMPAVTTIDVPTAAAMGVAIEGSAQWWPGNKKADEFQTAGSSEAVLPTFDASGRPTHYIDVFNRGQTPFGYTVETGAAWLTVSEPKGTVEKEERLFVQVDWADVPTGLHRVPITIHGPTGNDVVVQAVVDKRTPADGERGSFVEVDGYVSMEAEHASHTVRTTAVKWQPIPNIGRTGSGMMVTPVTAPSEEKPAIGSPRLEYVVNLTDSGAVRVDTYLSPTLNFNDAKSLRYAVSFDEEAPQVMAIHANETNRSWEQSVANNIRVVTSQHTLAKPGTHTLKIWMVDPAVVFQKLVVRHGDVRPSYLGPPESARIGVASTRQRETVRRRESVRRREPVRRRSSAHHRTSRRRRR